MSDHLGNSHIFIIDALRILSATGGSITCTPDKLRKWKIRNNDCCCESIHLSRACASFVEDSKNPEKL